MVGRFIMLAFLLTVPVLGVKAQEVAVLDHMAQYNMQWTASHPYLLEYSFRPFYRAGMIYERGSGDFRSAFQDQQYTVTGFQSESQKAIKDWRLQGTFSYRKILDQRKPYLLQKAASPSNPFTLADGQTDSWSGDQVDFSLIALSPVWLNRFRTHALIRYQVGSGNRNAEPRPLYRHSDLHVEIGGNFDLNDIIKIGIAGSFEQRLEENNVGAFAVQDFSLYQLRGISTFTRNTFQAFQRAQQENNLTAKAYISYSKQKDWGFLEIATGKGQYDAIDGIAFPVDAGNLELSKVNLSAGYNRALPNGNIWQSNFSWENASSMAIDPIFKAINYDFSQNSIKSNSALLFPDRMLRQIGINLSYVDENREETAGRDLLAFQNLEFGLATDVVIPFFSKHILWLKPSVGHRSNLSNIVQNNAVGLLKDIYDQELNYYSSTMNLVQIQANLISPIQNNLLNIGVNYSSEIASNASFNRISFSVGFIF